MGSIDRQVRQKALPDLALTGEGGRSLLPVVEVAHDGHRLRMGGPDPERPAISAPLFGRVG
ncbi:hypothetical protein GMJFJA_GMJFJA_01170, partial [Dysosmobacter welbionis]